MNARPVLSQRVDPREIRVLLFGLNIAIQVECAELLAKVYPLLPPGWQPSRSRRIDRHYRLTTDPSSPASWDGAVASGFQTTQRRPFRLVIDGDQETVAFDADALAAALESDLELFVSERAKGVVVVHAGVVGWRGKAVIIPGHSFSGKTTLVSELIRRGAEYYSDECAVFDDQGRVHPYSKPLHVRGRHRTRRRVVPEEFGALSGHQPLEVGLIVISRFRRGAVWRPRVISPGQTILQMLRCTSSARRHPDKALRILRHVVSGAVAMKGIRGEASDVADDLVSRLDHHDPVGASQPDHCLSKIAIPSAVR